MVYKADRRGMARMLASREILEAPMQAFAEAVKAEAEATAPYDPNSKDGTHFKESFHAEVIEDDVMSGIGGTHRAIVGHVYSDDPAALQIETGTSKTPAHNTLSNALTVLE